MQGFDFRKSVKKVGYDIVGSIFSSVGIYIFARTADFAPGGVSGLSLLIYHLWSVPLGISTIVLNIPLLLISLKFVGKRFMLRSLCSMIWCMFFLDAVFPFLPFYTGSKLLAAVYSGIFIGLGLAVFYMNGSSSGGTDFITMSVRAVRPHLSIGFVTMLIDLVIIALGWVVFGDIDAALYGLISTFITSFVIDKVMYRTGASKLLIIITTNAAVIADKISGLSHRGSTLISAKGSYTSEPRDVLLCACSRPQAYAIRQIATDADRKAFVILTDASEIFGEGFLKK